MAKKVEEQKGPIHPHQETYRTMTYGERVRERDQELEMLRFQRGFQKVDEPKQ
jgi:hypothetical protein